MGHPMSEVRRGTCLVCGREMNLKVDGRLRHHSGPDGRSNGRWGYRCAGAGKLPEVVDLVAALKHSLEGNHG
jgi:hypothetical protein